MVDLLERIGPYLGIAAFLGLAVLAFLIFQQAREVRRLRNWAGRAPERAGEADEAAAAATEARGEAEPVEPEEDQEPEPDAAPASGWRARMRARGAAAFAALDRRMPVDPRYLFAVIAAAVIAAAVLTSGFGLINEDSAGGGGKRGGQAGSQEPDKVEVAVLNATQTVADDGTPIAGVPRLATKVADQVVKPAGFKAGAETNAPAGFEETTIMFEPDAEAGAEELAAAVEGDLGETPVTPMIGDIREVAKGAPLALVIGLDDAEF